MSTALLRHLLGALVVAATVSSSSPRAAAEPSLPGRASATPTSSSPSTSAAAPSSSSPAWSPSVPSQSAGESPGEQPESDLFPEPAPSPTSDKRTLYLTAAARAGTGLGYSLSLGGMWFPTGLEGHNAAGGGFSLQSELGTRGFELDFGFGGGFMGRPTWCPFLVVPGLAWLASASMIYRGLTFEGAGETRSVLGGAVLSLGVMYVDVRGGLYFDLETGSPLGTVAIGVGAL